MEAYIDGCDAALLTVGLQNAAQQARGLGDTRTTPRLQADLLVELLASGQVSIGTGALDEAGSTALLAQRAPVSVEVLIPAATLAGQDDEAAIIAGFGAVDPVRARELLARAPSLRRIVRLRDGHCRAPGCSTPPTRCEIDHSLAYARGGSTALGNLACLCSNHHHLKHEAGWALRHYASGVLEWRSAVGRVYRTFPETELPAATEWDPAPFDSLPEEPAKPEGSST